MNKNVYLEQRGALTLDESCHYLGGISRPTMYKLLHDGKIPSLMIGTRRYFRRVSLDEYMAQSEGMWDVDERRNHGKE